MIEEYTVNDLNKPFKSEVLWRDLNYTIKINKSETKHISKELSGSFKFGELTAIMGPSGAGKSTLLESIMRKGHRKGLTGQVVFNCPKDPNIAFIPQENYFLKELTVKQVLWYSSQLKNGNNIDHGFIINDIIKQLGLGSCVNNRVTKCSGGELKRLAVAQELISSANILILDEPTSGLDSSTCYELIKLFQNLVKTDDNIAIVTTIHQPNTCVFNTFDKIYAISFNGQCVYEDSPNEIHRIFRSVGLECPNNYNPADYLIEICYGDHGLDKMSDLISKHKVIRSCDLKEKLEDNTDCSIPLKKVYGSIYESQFSFNTLTLLQKNTERSTYIGKHFRHIWLLFVRSIYSILCNYTITSLQIGVYTLSPVLISVLYNYKIGKASACPLEMANMTAEGLKSELQGINDNLAFIFFAFLEFMMGGIVATVLSFTLEMNVVCNETRNKWYDIRTYFIGRTLADAPFQCLWPIVYCAISYYMLGQLNEFKRFCLFSLIMIFVSFCAQSQGLIMGALFMKNLAAAVFIAVTSTVPIILFGGYFIRILLMPKFLRWLSYLSYFRYTFEAMIIVVYGFNRCGCSEKECQSSVMTDFDLTDNDIYISLAAIFAYFIILRIVTYFIVKFKILRNAGK